MGRDELELVNGTVLDRYTAAVRNEAGCIFGRIWTFRDVTQQKRDQRLQQEALDRLRKISNRVPGVVYQFRLRTDGSVCFPYASEGLEFLYHVRPDEVLEDASSVFSRIHPEDLEELLATILQSSVELSPFRCDFRVLFADGTIRWVSGNSLPEREADGATLWHGFMGDSTAIHEAATELQEARFS